MPSKFGSVTKAFVVQDGKLDANSPSGILASPENAEEFIGLVERTQGLSKQEIQDEVQKFLAGKQTRSNRCI